MVANIVDTDVLIIGGGLAGCWAAIAAKSLAPRVTLVDKAAVSRSGCSSWAYYPLAPTPTESLADWREELVEQGEYLNDQDWVEVVLKEHGQRLADMERWGVPFQRNGQGDLIRRKGRGHNKTSFVVYDGRTAMEVLKKKVSDLGVQIRERVMVTDLLTSDGSHPTRGAVIGAVGFDTRSKEFLVFRSRATVITSGPLLRRSNLSGDGVAVAFRGGAELTSMEFCVDAECHLTDGAHDLGSFNGLMASLGGRILNARGERFMEKYAPVLKERTSWALLTQALAKEHLEDRTPVVWDLSTAKAEDIDYFEKYHPERVAPFKRAGIDLKKERILFISEVNIESANGNGGIKIDLDGKTNLPGLYGAGSVCKNHAQGNDVVGLNLAFCTVSGHRAGAKAGSEGKQTKLEEVVPDQLEFLRKQIYSPLEKRTGLAPDQVIRRIREITNPAQFSIFKTEERIRETINTLDKLEKDELPEMRARDVHELAKAHQAINIALCAKLVFLSALGRKESRWFHYRADYPYTDNKDWLKRSIIKPKDGGDIELTFEPVPIDRYPVKPRKRERVPHPVQL